MAEAQRINARPSRRTLLKAAIYSAGAAVAAPLLVAAQPLERTGLPLKVGVLLPESSRYPRIAANLLDGMRLSLTHAAQVGRPAISLWPTTYQGTISSAHAAVQTLIERDKVDLVVAAFDSQAAAGLRPMIEQSRVPLIAADSGANLIRSSDRSPYLTYNTINAWQSSWALGDWAARAVGRNAVVVASCYESGYDTLYTFELGFTAAGGTIHKTHITHVPGRADDWPTLLRTISSAKPDVVYAMYSGAEAADFATAYTQSSLAGRVPLLEGNFIGSDGTGSLNCGASICSHTASSWNPALDTPINRTFLADYRQITQRNADSFAVLGYDTGRLIVEAARKSSRAAHLPEALADVSFVGPRGRVQIDPATRAFTTPIYLHTAQQNGTMDVSQHSVLSSIRADDPRLESFMAAPKTGWLYPYLIA